MEEQSFGEKAVGVKFNPSGASEVDALKQAYAFAINSLNEARTNTTDGEKKRLYSVAITEAQGACMWAVKAATWNI